MGGLMLDIIITFVNASASLPLGVLLAFGRLSKAPVVRMLATGYIEFWRGVPLLAVLFMATLMLPMFLPSGVSVDNLIRLMIAMVFFYSAYMAEVIRGGLQGVPRGQEEAASSLGMKWWQIPTHRYSAAGAPAGGAEHYEYGRGFVQGYDAGDDYWSCRCVRLGQPGVE